MNLINRTHHSSERKKHIFIVLRKYTIIFHHTNTGSSTAYILLEKYRAMNPFYGVKVEFEKGSQIFVSSKTRDELRLHIYGLGVYLF